MPTQHQSQTDGTRLHPQNGHDALTRIGCNCRAGQGCRCAVSHILSMVFSARETHFSRCCPQFNWLAGAATAGAVPAFKGLFDLRDCFVGRKKGRDDHICYSHLWANQMMDSVGSYRRIRHGTAILDETCNTSDIHLPHELLNCSGTMRKQCSKMMGKAPAVCGGAC